jgi:aminopeptidase N
MHKPIEIFLKDYQSPSFEILDVNLTLDIYDDHTVVTNVMNISRRAGTDANQPLVLNGVELKLIELKIDGENLSQNSFEEAQDLLTIYTTKKTFNLIIVTHIHPETNFSGSGFYTSGHIFCTQCEPEGFRRITYFLDRPDVMTKYTTTLIADKKKYPKLLSNGNLIHSEDLREGRHKITWQDPFAKPSYLFAAVAGDLACVRDNYVTKSGRKVALEIFVDHGNEDKTSHAMQSLKDSMRWDEERFNLEYDLDIYMIVAVDSFNMGAMENKGLNIFNSAYVLARQDTATDTDFQGIQAVIGHEYFHNWTGNRVTCRDWFQLTLKEGLTVFRDQEFTSDMLSRPVKRIEDVKRLRENQFPEDAGPLSHPIKPKSFREINNFYTQTIYEKGAEVIRMIQTLIGVENFKKGMELYFKRHDGQAVTTEDFVQAMQDVSHHDLSQFKLWYDQNGTPELFITTSYDSSKHIFSFTIKQSVKLNNDSYEALYMPFHIGLFNQQGEEYKLTNDGKFILSQKEETFVIPNILDKPIVSWNRGFSAPVKIDYNVSVDDLLFLMNHDSDSFNRYDCVFKLYEREVLNLVNQQNRGESLSINPKLIDAFGTILKDETLDSAYKCYLLTLPSEDYINEKFHIRLYEEVNQILKFFKQSLYSAHQDTIQSLYHQYSTTDDFQIDAKAMGKRSLRNILLTMLSQIEFAEKEQTLLKHFTTASNMTDELNGFKCIVNNLPNHRLKASDSFVAKWKNETLIMQKWVAIMASRPGVTVKDLQEVESSPWVDLKIPNFVRALLRTYIAQNPVSFNDADGSGYVYVTDKILELDKINPQIAAGLAKSLRHLKHLDPIRKTLLKSQLDRLSKSQLSNDTYEVVLKNLEDA